MPATGTDLPSDSLLGYAPVVANSNGTTPASVPASAEVRQMQTAMMVRELFYRARDARRPLVQQWKKNYKVLNNRMWTARAEPWQPAPEVSNIWPIVASLVAWMTDQRPQMETVPSIPPFSPEADYYDKVAEQMNAVLHAAFVSYDIDAELEKILWDVATYSVGYSKVVWEPWLADGLGDSTLRRVDPFYLYPDPYARSADQLNYIIEAKIMSVEDVDRAWPGARRLITAGEMEQIDESPHKIDATLQQNQPRLNLGPLSPSTSTRYQASARYGATSVREDPVVLVLETWIRIHEVTTHAQDNTIPPGTARVTDRWKCIVSCGNTILMEKYADEIYGHNTHPYNRMVLFETGEWYGPCLVEFLTSPQESINRILGSIEHNLMLMGNPVLRESPRIPRVTRTNRPGQKVRGNQNDYEWISPPAIHPDSIQMIQYYESKIETISGLSAIVRGFSPSGRNSSEVMSSVQDSAFVRVRASLRNLERLLRGACHKMVANMAEFYTEPRMVSLLGPDRENVRVALRARHFYTLNGGNLKGASPMRFTILADAGSEHATSRAARGEEAKTLYAMGAIDERELLIALRWPNAGQTALRVMEQKAEQGVLGQPPGARQRTGRSS